MIRVDNGVWFVANVGMMSVEVLWMVTINIRIIDMVDYGRIDGHSSNKRRGNPYCIT